jgi:hypothetical protein
VTPGTPVKPLPYAENEKPRADVGATATTEPGK